LKLQIKKTNKHIVSIICIYTFSVFLDIYTTYLGTPLLKYEGNYLIVKLNLGWIEIISLSTIGVTILSTMFIYGQAYIYKNKSFNYKYILAILGITGFTYHFVYSVFVFSNNYLSHIYLHKTKHILCSLSQNYIVFKSPFNYFYVYIQGIILIISITMTLFLIKRQKKTQFIAK